jgi:hypothetical protein
VFRQADALRFVALVVQRQNDLETRTPPAP